MSENTAEANPLSTPSLAMIFLMTALIVIAVTILLQAGWVQWRFSSVEIDDKPANDPRSQREAYLEAKALKLVSSVADVRDINVMVQITGQLDSSSTESSEIKTVLILVNETKRSGTLAQAITAIVSTGLAMDASRGDSLALQFHEFSHIAARKENVLGLSLIQRTYLGLIVLFIGVCGFAWASFRYKNQLLKVEHARNAYQDQLQRFKLIASDEPARVASVMSDWLNGVKDR
ncbi:Uncharacterised protein [Zhongshania aliphaticivorans]|uniref:Uncharacterized protein n=1 Tax=Zhongshania aliphaticivorans TaxID=1470434 RepID=A0A5S9NCC1_9GAMM|nr:hypothetical protein [Zhongshania aliphaticivorans]CAA0087733.1 Uncharacterised protein [Zhongshania aliphaticivorans]CAA0115377.1 Uncharacterised protein [Zhongshania aliphaticivorans]CAA0120193.1 Uncharacterised protein [Zhongshania aliphaticivorans]